MRKSYILSAFVLILFVSNANAQKFDLGKVSIKELGEKVCPSDTTAAAAVLYSKARTFFVYNYNKGFSISHEYEMRIKIYKKAGLSWASYRVPYYVGYENLKDEVVKFSNGVTYNLENGAIVKTKLNNEGSFKNNVNENWSEATIAMPNVKVGSVIEFKYVLSSENIVEFPVFYFQQDIPVNYAEYKTQVPEFFVYNPILAGVIKAKVDSKVVDGFQSYDDDRHRMQTMNYQQVNNTFTAENVPALKEEKYVDNLQNYRSSVHNELEKKVVPDAHEVNYASTWEGVAKNIYKHKEFGDELKERLYLENDLKMILKNVEAPSERLDVIFRFVKEKMNWNNKYGYLTKHGVKQAYIEKTGNSAEINFILIAMLNYAGIKTSPVLVSTISQGLPLFPNRTVFNYVIAAAEIDGKNILLDATNKYTTLNVLPLYTLNWTGRLIRADGNSEEINLVPTTQSKEIRNLLVSIDDSGKITGRARVQKTDYTAFSFREEYAKANRESYIEKLENSLGNAKISEYQVDNMETDLAKPVSQTFAFTSDNQIEIIGDKMYINPLLFYTGTKNPFVQEKREYPIYYGHPFQDKYNISIEIPKGYAIESVPKSITFASPENVGLFTYKIVAAENKIQVAITADINLAIIAAGYYDYLKDFYQKMIDKQNEKIILKKI